MQSSREVDRVRAGSNCGAKCWRSKDIHREGMKTHKVGDLEVLEQLEYGTRPFISKLCGLKVVQ